MVNNKFQLTKQSSESEIKAYFIQVLNLARSKEEFPVNLDEVWPLVYATKGKAVQSLKKSELFIEGVDYQTINQKVKREVGSTVLVHYKLSVPCLEFFIARKVRPVFEVYRQVFHKVANGGVSLGNQSFQSKPMGVEETLAPLSRFHAMIEDRFDILKSMLIQNNVELKGFDSIEEKCRTSYFKYRDYIDVLVYVETACKLDGPKAFSLFDE